MANAEWKLLRHCPAVSYKYNEKIYIHAVPMGMSFATAAMALREEILMLCFGVIGFCLFYYCGYYWMPLAAIPCIYPLFAVRTKKIIEHREFNSFSGDPGRYSIVDGILVTGLKYRNGDEKIIDLYLFPELLWLKNPQPLSFPPDRMDNLQAILLSCPA